MWKIQLSHNMNSIIPFFCKNERKELENKMNRQIGSRVLKKHNMYKNECSILIKIVLKT
jgi:hypothetical protein